MNKEVFLLNEEVDFKAVPTKGIRWIVTPEDAYNGGSSVVIQEFSLSDEGPFPPTLPIPIPPSQKPTDPGTPFPTPPLSEPTPPSPPKDDYSLPRIGLSTSRSNSILVPLFDTQISLWTAQNSAVEVMFKRLQRNVQVGIHLGIMATEGGGRRNNHSQSQSSVEARKVTEMELWSLLHPDIKQPQQRNRRASSLGELDLEVIERADLSEYVEDAPLSLAQFTQRHLSLADASESTGVLAVLTMDDPTSGSDPVGRFLALTPSPGDEGSVYTVEALGDGWSRLTLHLSRLLALNGEQQSSDDDSGSDLDLSSIILSQLGVTLTFDSQKRHDEDVLGQCGEKSPQVPQPPPSSPTRPLVILGSLAVVPTWSAHYRGSSIQGLKGDDNHVIIVDRPDLSSSSPPHEQDVADSPPATSASLSLPFTADAAPVRPPHPLKTRLRISSTLSWDIGFPIVPPGEEELMSPRSGSSLTLSSYSSLYQSVDDTDMPSVDYSHFCIYISTRTRAAAPSSPQPPQYLSIPSSSLRSPTTQLQSKDVSPLPGSTAYSNVDDKLREEQCLFLGTAFTNQYRISNLEILIEGLNPDALREDIQSALQKQSQSQQEQQQPQPQPPHQKAESDPVQKSLTNSSGNGVWLWVQGVRRDGRADARSDWAKWRLI